MSAILVVVFLALAVLSLYSYNGTPHSGPPGICGRVDLFGQIFSVPFSCQDFSIGELVVGGVCFAAALAFALLWRPSRGPVE